MARYASAEIAAVTLLALTLPSSAGVGGIATTVPERLPSGGFLLVSVPASRRNTAGMRNPTVQVDVLVAAPTGGGRPPWGAASQLAEAVVDALDTPGTFLPLIDGMEGFVLHQWHTATEPRRVPRDSRGYARFTLDFELFWTPTREVAIA